MHMNMNESHRTTAQPAILLCTLGASWAVVAEVFGWLAPDVVDLYAHHPQHTELAALRRQYELPRPDELWICTTEGEQTHASLTQLRHWWRLLGEPLPLRVWTAAGTDQLASQHECAHIRELTLRVTLLASERSAGRLVLSLAGGRKTMSADLQAAGSVLGARAWLHVVGPEPMPPALLGRESEYKAALPELLTQPLPAALAQAVMPLVAGSGQRHELLDIAIEERAVCSRHFPLPLPLPGQACAWPLPAEGATLTRELQQRQQQSGHLLGNFLAQLAQTEQHENWRSLYRLLPARIQQLRQTPLAPAHRPWLRDLPKADLHRHLGGCLDLAAQRQVAQAIWDDMNAPQREHSLRHIAPLLQTAEWDWTWPAHLRARHAESCVQSHTADPAAAAARQRAQHSAALLLHASDIQLQRHLFDVTQPRVALKQHHPQGFAAYERPGELSGSALLGHPAAVAPYARAIVTQAVQEGLHYVELRGSPHKYCRAQPAQFIHALRDALQQAGAHIDAQTLNRTGTPAPRIGFIWILDRRQPDDMEGNVAQAVAARHTLGDFLLGLDLAGDEGTSHPEKLAPKFARAFADCLPLTIHAGEGESAENIWQATYHLHADRIGHGLTLADNPRLAARFRDRGICLELCPTSNREVVGFHDPEVPASAGLPRYPLRQFLHAGLPLTLCTNNPGISRTTLADEYLAAARMSEGGLTQWEALALMRQAFAHAFLPAAERDALLKHADQAAFRLLATTDPAHPLS